MINLEEKRAYNKKRLLGLNPDKKTKTPYSKSDCTNPEVCWDIISMVVRFKTQEIVRKDGVKQNKTTNKLAYPELFEVVEVGERKTTTKNAKKASIIRTNIDTMREMYKTRNEMNRYYADDLNDDYIEYFKSVVEILDEYAITVVADMIEAKSTFLDEVNAIRCK